MIQLDVITPFIMFCGGIQRVRNIWCNAPACRFDFSRQPLRLEIKGRQNRYLKDVPQLASCGW